MIEEFNPKFDYLLCKEAKDDTGVVTTADVADHWQKYEVLAVGPGRVNDEGRLLPVDVKVGEVVYVQKHAEADTPPDLKEKGYYLIMASRVMAGNK